MTAGRVVTGGSAHRSRSDSDARKTKLREECYDLRLAGHTLREIGQRLDISKDTVLAYLREEIAGRLDPLKDQYLQYELDRLDAYQRAALHVLDNPGRVVTVMVDVEIGTDEGGNPIIATVPQDHVILDHNKILGAIDRLVKISESRRKLTGLDAPVRTQVDVVETTQEDLELQELLREAKARAAAAAEKIQQTGGGE